MIKEVIGFCKFCNQDKSIKVDYIVASEFNNNILIKNRYTPCENCNNKCELYSNAAGEIRY